jgi:hypothetical protein
MTVRLRQRVEEHALTAYACRFLGVDDDQAVSRNGRLEAFERPR